MSDSITLEDLPTEIIQKIVYNAISPLDFVNLGMVSKELNLITGLINYPGFVDYENIKKIKNKSRFKTLALYKNPEPDMLDEINPTLLDLNIAGTNRETLKIPASVQILKASYAVVSLDPVQNGNLKSLMIDFSTVIGEIPNSVSDLCLGEMLYKIDHLTGLKRLAVDVCNYIRYGNTVQLCYPQLVDLLRRNKDLELLNLGFIPFDFEHTGGLKSTHYTIPNLPNLVTLSITISGSHTPSTINFEPLPNLRDLQIETANELRIENPPNNLNRYHFKKSERIEKSWNNTLNISAQQVVIETTEKIEYVCDNRVKSVIIVGGGRAKLSDSVIHYRLVTPYEVSITDTKNLESLEIRSLISRINMGKLKYLSAISDYMVELQGDGTDMIKLAVSSLKVIGNLSKSKVEKILYNVGLDLDDLQYPKTTKLIPSIPGIANRQN